MLDRGDWTFTHDHVREAVLGAIAPVERAALHLAITRRLRAANDERIPAFLIATQANLARPAVVHPIEHRAFALINLEAGKRAKAATAHHAALDFFGWTLTWLGDEQTSPEALEASLALVDRTRIGTIVQGAQYHELGLQAWSGGSPEPLTPEQQGWRNEALSVVLPLISAGSFEVEIGKVLPLDEAVEAHRLSEQGGVRGKIVLVP